jgi:hypothetical protein
MGWVTAALCVVAVVVVYAAAIALERLWWIVTARARWKRRRGPRI